MRGRLTRFALISAALGSALVATGCTSTVKVQPEHALPRSLIVPLPATAGLVLDESLRAFRQEETRGGINWQVRLGPGHERLLREVMGASFREVRVFDSLDAARGQADVNVIFTPVIEQYSFASARDTTAGHWAVTIRYRVGVLTPAGEPIETLALSGYGSGRDQGGDTKSLDRATVAAMRDAAAKFLVQFPQQPVAAQLKAGAALQARGASAPAPEEMVMLPIDADG